MNHNSTLLFLFFLFAFWTLEGQTTFDLSSSKGNKILELHKVKVENDYFSNNIKCAYKDSRGFMWFGTSDGIYRFDGKTTISFNTTTHPTISFNNVVKIFEDDKGYLWVLNMKIKEDHWQVADVYFIDVNTLEISLWNDKIGDSVQIGDGTFTDIVPGKDNEVYFVQSFREVKYVYSDGKLMEKDFPIPDFYRNWSSNLSEEQKNIFFSHFRNLKTKEGIFTHWKMVFGMHMYEYMGEDNEGSDIIYDKYVTQDFKHSFYKYDRNYELRKVDIENVIPKEKEIINYTYSRCFYNASSGDYWFYDSDEFFVFNPDSEFFYDIKKNHPSTRHGRILNIYFDDDITWLCDATGLFSIEIKDNKFDHHLVGGVNSTKLHSCRSIYTSNNKEVTIATVSYLIESDGNQEKILRKGNFSPILAKTKDSLLLGSNHVNLLTEGEKIEVIAQPESHNSIWCFLEDEELHGYWVGRIQGLGFFEMGKDKKMRKLDSVGFKALKNLSIFHMIHLRNGNLLLATSRGIYEVDKHQGVVSRYWNGGDSNHYLPLDEYYYIYQEDNGFIWLGSNGGGLILWDKETGEYKQYTREDGLSNNIICAIYGDDYNNLWLSTFNGLCMLNKTTEDIRVFKTEDGISHNEFNRSSHFKSPDGKLYFGGINGVNSFYPKDLLFEKTNEDFPIYITDLHHYKINKDELVDQLADYRTEQVIRLKPEDAFVDIKVSLLDYHSNGNINYYYQIEGLNDKWYSIHNNILRLSGLPYDDYNIRIRGKMANGQFSKSELNIPLKVIQPFYLRWWFLSLVVLSLGLAVLLLLQHRTRLLLSRKAELESQVFEQTKELKKDKELIEKQAAELKELDEAKSKFFANISHELRTPITLIQGPIQSLLKKGGISDRDYYLLEKANKSSEDLLGLVNELLDLTKLEAKRLELNENEVILFSYLKQKLGVFQSMAELKGIDLSLKYLPHQKLKVYLDANQMGKVLTNLLSNAFRFTNKGGSITLVVEELEKKLLFKIRDNGRGIPEEDLPHVFNRFYQSRSNDKAEGGFGIGLSFSMEIIKLMKGKMWVESAVEGIGKGTTFYIEIPKKEITSVDKEIELVGSASDLNKIPTESYIRAKDVPASNSVKKEYTILIVEDHKDLQEYIYFLLSPIYEVVTKDNGKEALQWIESGHRPSLIISDYMMPLMDGIQFLNYIKKDPSLRSIPFILLTARTEKRDRLLALRIGVDDYLTKPFLEEELEIRIQNLLENQRQRMAFLSTEKKSLPNVSKVKEPSTAFVVSDQDKEWLLLLEKTIVQEVTEPCFSIDYLAEKLSINRDKLFKKTKSITGLTPNQYTRIVKLKLAKDLLENQTYKTVKEVAHHIGFLKVDYFSSLYKKEYGKSPSEYLK